MKFKHAVVALVGVVALALAGCGDDNNNDFNNNPATNNGVNQIVLQNGSTFNLALNTNGSNAKNQAFTTTSDTSVTGALTLDGLNRTDYQGFISIPGQAGGTTRSVNIEISDNTGIVATDNYTAVANIVNNSVSITYNELDLGGGASRTFVSTGGTVTVLSISGSQIRLQFNNVTFSPSAVGGNSATGNPFFNGEATLSVN